MPSILGETKSRNESNRHKTIIQTAELDHNDRFVHCKNDRPIILTLPAITKDVVTLTIYADCGDQGNVNITPKGTDTIELTLTISEQSLVELISDYESKTWRIN